MGTPELFTEQADAALVLAPVLSARSSLWPLSLNVCPNSELLSFLPQCLPSTFLKKGGEGEGVSAVSRDTNAAAVFKGLFVPS